MEPFIFQDKSNIPYFSLDAWEEKFPGLFVGFSGRFPHDNEERRNYALHVGENKQQTIRNRRELVEHLGFTIQNWTCGEQVHLTHVIDVQESDKGRGSTERESAFPQIDGMVTEQTNLFLASFYADCVPLFFYSPDIECMGVAHAGWKGTVHGMARKMVQCLQAKGAKVSNMHVAIGPSIGICCYEVNHQVMNPIKKLFSDTSQIAVPVDEKHDRIDLKQVNQKLILQMGVNPVQLVVSNWCTSCAPYFYSHRRDKGKTGRMVAWIAKK